MRVPCEVAEAIARGYSLGFSCLSDGTVTGGFESGWGGGAYPPPGYLPWNILDVGNGDTYGYYWALGREDDEPLVCTLMHDAWGLLPEASSIGACIRDHLLSGAADTEELEDAARNLRIDISDIPLPAAGEFKEPFSLDGPPWTDMSPRDTSSAHEALSRDPGCPHLRLVAAREAIGKRQLAEAEAHLEVALARLPEYADALALLAQLHRQRQNQTETARFLMEAITAPLCFGAYERKKLLHWLQRMSDGAGDAVGDPLWKRRHDLSFVEGVKEKDDYRVLEELIGEYHRLGMGVRAVRLRILTGEMMGHETVSFRERQEWTGAKYRSLLRTDLERAGLKSRLVAL